MFAVVIAVCNLWEQQCNEKFCMKLENIFSATFQLLKPASESYALDCTQCLLDLKVVVNQLTSTYANRRLTVRGHAGTVGISFWLKNLTCSIVCSNLIIEQQTENLVDVCLQPLGQFITVAPGSPPPPNKCSKTTHRDKAPAHSVLSIRQFSVRNQMTLQPAYFPDLVSIDSF